LADTLAADFTPAGSVFTIGNDSLMDGEASDFLGGSSSFATGAGRFGGGLANADMMLPEDVRFMVVVEGFVGSGTLLLDI